MTTRRLKAVLEADDRATKPIQSFGSVLKWVGGIAATVGAYQIGRQLVGGLEAATDAAAAQEKADVKLAQAIRNTGKSVERLLPAYKNMAGRLQDISGVGDEVINSQQAMLVAFGATEQNMEKLSRAALDLAAGTDMTLESAFRNIGRTLGGFQGELGEIIPELKELTKEQLAAGEAADIILDKFGGQAQANLNTYAGSVKALTSRWGDLLEQLGNAITQSPVVRESIQRLSDAIKELTENLKNSNEGVRAVAAVVDAFLWLAGAAVSVVEGVGVIVLSFNDLFNQIPLAALKAAREVVEVFDTMVEETLESIQKLPQGVRKLLGIDSAAVSIEGFVDNITSELDGLVESWQESADASVQAQFDFTNVTNTIRQNVEKTRKALQGLGEDAVPSAGGGEGGASPETGLAGGKPSVPEGPPVPFVGPQRSPMDTVGGGFFAELREVDFAAISKHMKATKKAGIDFEAAMENAVGAWAQNAASELAGTLTDGLFGAKKASDSMVENLVRGLIEAVAQALILKSIMAALDFGGGGGGFLSGLFERGGIVGAARGHMVPGYDTGRDSQLIMARPGEAVLPREIVDYILGGAAGAGGGQPVVHLHGSLPALVDSINVETRSGRTRLLATETVGSSRRVR